MNKVFVYGTLKKGYSNAGLMKNASFIGNGYTCDLFRMGNVGFPVIMPDDEGKPVAGEVYEVDHDTMVRLDSLEAEGHMYDRIALPIVLVDDTGQSMDAPDCYLYVGNRDYWLSGNRLKPYTHTNKHGELEWHP